MAPQGDLAVEPGLTIPAAELQVVASRSSGPGGQHVNTTETRVQLRWNVLESQVLAEEQKERLARRLAARLSAEGVLTVACDTHRSQRRNRDEARERLAALVRASLHTPRPRRPTQVPRAAREARLERKRRQAAVKRRRRRLDDD
ncbi:MAG TPA: alternative ribosome rescue aminoacyl-tRNA hydrolase ArfB [Candidatus Krumholzibacteria bacterium]|nr:alternative ribosome rescue aminoacyl-tRNA hydrolase ArfB [Candidatus Krumholzibacteria bacterium]HPD72637.1 alternative ribosome rescue aminoacyl-tRNA hydrolase ArfB [Candidatus Krumholzibacteria bacterium]HRY40431.1 alternative ribosome rescue aminoacyl-tRNA hydrolase ArfB [Candidatus Krumholzibacteria bacterium]